MAIIAKKTGGAQYDPAPAGVHVAVCVDVIDLGLLEVTYSGKTKKQHKVRLAWQIGEDREDGKPFLVQKQYTLSLSEKATMRADLESWRGRPFTPAEEGGFDVETIIGAPCMLNIVHETKEGKTYANIKAVMPLMKGASKIVPRDYVRVCDRPPVEGEPAASEEHAPFSPVTDEDIPF